MHQLRAVATIRLASSTCSTLPSILAHTRLGIHVRAQKLTKIALLTQQQLERLQTEL